MYILTQSKPFENSKSTTFVFEPTSVALEYPAEEYQRRSRHYKLICGHKDYNIECPEYINIKNAKETTVLIPEFLIPGRPYPLYIYLYAIDLYSSNPEMGQREAAEKTRKRFGLTTFSHTTLGRALKRFIKVIDEDKLTEEATTDLTASVSETDIREFDSGSSSLQRSFPTVEKTGSMRTKAASVLKGIIIQDNFEGAKQFCFELARERFKENGRFLL